MNQNVVDAVVHEVAADRVVNASREGNLQFCADAISRGYQHRLPHPGKRAVEHAAEAANLRKRARIESSARKFFDLFRRAIGRVDIYAGRRVGCRFCHWNKKCSARKHERHN